MFGTGVSPSAAPPPLILLFRQWRCFIPLVTFEEHVVRWFGGDLPLHNQVSTVMLPGVPFPSCLMFVEYVLTGLAGKFRAACSICWTCKSQSFFGDLPEIEHTPQQRNEYVPRRLVFLDASRPLLALLY